MADGKKGTFADLLDGTWNLVSRTWMTSLVLGGVLFIPSAYLFGWAYGAFMDGFKGIAEMGRQDPATLLSTLGIAYLWIFLAALVQGVLFLFVRACVTEHSARAVRGEPANTFTIALHVMTHTYLRLLGQRILQMVILSITFGAAVLITSVAAGILASLHLIALAVLAGCLLGLAGLGVSIWIAIRYTVTLESMVVDGTGIDQSFDQSMALVRRRWWRVFGYTLLFGLMVSFASTLIGTPIMFFSTIRQFMHALESVLRDASGPRSANAVFMQLLVGLGRRLGILQYIQSLIAGFVTPVFMTLLFLELKRPEPEPAPLPQEALPAGTGS
ncbi:MAG: hypothetical protein ACLQCB_10400 [Spirochaetia bacterium]